MRNKKIHYIVFLFIIVLFAVVALGFRNSKDKDLRVQDYFPSRIMTKEFSGGYEKEGFTHIVHEIENDKILITQWDTGTGVALVYEVSENDIRLVYSETGEGFSKDYFNEVVTNRNQTILKAPLEVGTTWSNADGKYEITGINVRVITRRGVYYAIEVTYQGDGYTQKYYYAKNIGLVKSTGDLGNDNLIRIRYGKNN